MSEQCYLRYPHLARDLVTFAARDGVWLASLSDAAGGKTAQAWPLAGGQGPVRHPRLNPAATHVAWTAAGDGSRSLGRATPREAYAASVDGGPVTRLTYWGDRFAAVRGWVGDGEVLVLSRAGQDDSHKTWAFAVPLRGPARRLGYGPVGDVAVRDGAVLAGTPVNFEPAEPAYWKGYRGGAGGQIWYSPDGALYTRILAEVGGNLVNPMFVGGRDGTRVAFLSDHEGTGALYSALPDGSDLRRHTELGEYYARNATTDGERVVYQRAGELWLLDSLGATPARLAIELPGTSDGRAPYEVPAEPELRSFTLNENGTALGAEVRGTVHWLPAAGGPGRALLTEPGVRGRLPAVIPGADAVACASDRGGEDGLEVLPADGSPPRRIGHGAFGRITELAVAPDGRTAAVACADGRLLTVALSGEPVLTEVARSDNAQVTGLAFSPDSALLAWAQPWRPQHGASRIRLARLADGTVTDVTPPRFDDTSPAFTLDGRYLAFLSNRAFDPVFDAHAWDLAFLPGVRPYLVTLQATTVSPFGPVPGESPVTEASDSGRPAVLLDRDGLDQRVVPFPVAAGSYSKLRAVDGGVTWLSSPLTGVLGEAAIGADDEPRTRLIRYDLVRGERTTEADGLEDYAVSGDGTLLACRGAGELLIKPVAAADAVPVDLERVRVTIDPPADWAQMYDEAWRLMRDTYWHPGLGGVDWAAAGDRYRPLLGRLGSADDLYDVLMELHGEIRSSHAGLRPPPAGGDPALAQGLLGADLAPGEDGTWRITRIVPGESSVLAARSPLAAPGVAAAAGDLIVAVDGQPVDPGLGPNALLVGKAGVPVSVTLRRAGTDRQVVVVPLDSEHAVRYYDLTARQRAAVRSASGGRLGYLRLPGMMADGWAELHRDLPAEFRCDGLIVDLRDTQGGDVGQLIVEKLARRITGWEFSRYQEPSTYPADAPRGPVVAITDGYASSGGDLVIQALKAYGAATVVGTRTWGGTRGIDFTDHLVDGAWAAQPRYSWWFADGGWSTDNYGIDPDVEVPIAPHDWAAGRDPQLETAIRLALEALEKHPPAAPPGAAGGAWRPRE